MKTALLVYGGTNTICAATPEFPAILKLAPITDGIEARPAVRRTEIMIQGVLCLDWVHEKILSACSKYIALWRGETGRISVPHFIQFSHGKTNDRTPSGRADMNI